MLTAYASLAGRGRDHGRAVEASADRPKCVTSDMSGCRRCRAVENPVGYGAQSGNRDNPRALQRFARGCETGVEVRYLMIVIRGFVPLLELAAASHY